MSEKLKMFTSFIYLVLLVMVFIFWDSFSYFDLPFLTDIIPGAGFVLFILTGLTISLLVIPSKK